MVGWAGLSLPARQQDALKWTGISYVQFTFFMPVKPEHWVQQVTSDQLLGKYRVTQVWTYGILRLRAYGVPRKMLVKGMSEGQAIQG